MKKTEKMTFILEELDKKEFFKQCKENDLSPSQVLRKYIKGYIKDNDNKKLTK